MNKILVVDDDPDIHAFINHDLRESDYEVHSASTPEEAIRLLGEFSFRFAIVDIFSGKNGSFNKVIHFLKQDLAGENKNIPMIIISARIDESYARKLILKGPTVFETIRKPIKSGEIRKLLEGKDSLNILAVDDDPDILSLIKRELISAGYKVFGALDNFQAINLMKSTEFVAAIVDNKMGEGKDTEEIGEFLEELPSNSQMPLILTGKKINQTVKNNHNLLVFDTIEKPFKRGSFLESVEKIRLWQNNVAHSSDDESPFSQVISGVTEHLNEDSERVQGHEENENEETVVSGEPDHDEEATNVSGNGIDKDEEDQEPIVVSGHSDPEEESTTVGGFEEDLDEERTMIHGEKEVLEDEKWSVKRLKDSKTKEQGPNQRNKDGLTPVMAYCYTGDVGKVRELIELGADLNLKARNGKTCLHYAAYSKNIDLVNMLVTDFNLKINERDEQKKEPLYDALKANDPEMVDTLIRLGARTSSKYEGRNYLTLAVMMRHSEVAKVFFKHGLSPKDKDYGGKNALDYAQKYGLKDLYRELS